MITCFDCLPWSRESPEKTKDWKLKEIKNGRLAMLANLGFWAQYAATGKGPIDNLLDHLKAPLKTTFVDNVSHWTTMVAELLSKPPGPVVGMATKSSLYAVI